jgi:hypothetical protein
MNFIPEWKTTGWLLWWSHVWQFLITRMVHLRLFMFYAIKICVAMKVCRDCWRLRASVSWLLTSSFKYVAQKKMAKRWCRRYSDSLRAGDPDVLTTMRARDFLFPALVETGFGAHPVSCKIGTCAVPWGYASRAWRWSPTPSSTDIKEWGQLHLYAFCVSLAVLWSEHFHLLQYYLHVPIISPFVSPSFHCPESTLLSVSFLMTAGLFCDFSYSLAFKLLIYASS